MDPGGQFFGSFGINRPLLDDATKGQFDVLRGAADLLIKFHIARRGTEIVSPKKARDSPPCPDAFRRADPRRKLRRRVLVFLDRLVYRLGPVLRLLGVPLGGVVRLPRTFLLSRRLLVWFILGE